MNLSEFAEQRNVKVNALWNYIARHPEIKEHTVKDGKKVKLLPEAVELLDKAYPLPKPVEIIEDTESIKKLALAEAKIIELQEKLLGATEKIAKAEATTALLEDKERQLEDYKSRLKKAVETNERANDEIVRQRVEIGQLTTALEQEQSKSWWDKLLGR